MNEFAIEYNYNCKYWSTKSSLQNLHETYVKSLWMNLLLSINVIVSIVQQNLPYKIYMKTSIFFYMNEFAFKYEYNCKYCLVFSQQKVIFKYCAYLFYFFCADLVEWKKIHENTNLSAI